MGGTAMTTSATFAPLLERFFTDRLMRQRQASPHTVASYRDTFRQLLQFIQQRLHKAPSKLTFEQIDAPLIVEFLDHLEKNEGLRISEMTGLQRQDIVLGTGAHVRVIGKGRKERCTPLAKSTVSVLNAWLKEPQRGSRQTLFPNAEGERLTVHGVQYMLSKHSATASRLCPSLKQKRVTVHVLRHTVAMDLLQEGIDRAIIALWLGHESVETTYMYVEATLAMKEKALAKTSPPRGRLRLYRPDDQLLHFLNDL